MSASGAGVERAAAQGILGRPHRTSLAVARHLVGLQAQDTAAARLQVRARSTSTTAADVTEACAAPGGLVRTWLFRGTLHAVAAADVRWLLRLVGARNAARGAGRRRQLGLDDDLLRRAGPALERVLDRPRSRADVVAALARRGVSLDPAGQAPHHLLAWAASQGLVCRGPDLDDGAEPSYVGLDGWVPPDPGVADTDPEELAVRLARRYLAGYAPAGPGAARDLAAWSGLPLGAARRALAALDDDPAERVAGRTPTVPPAPPDGPVVRLLGAYDPLLLGYRDRSPTLDPATERRVNPGGGTLAPTVTVDGRVQGTWTQARRGDRLDVTVRPVRRLPRGVGEALEDDVADLARFLGVRPGRLTVTS